MYIYSGSFFMKIHGALQPASAAQATREPNHPTAP